MAGQPPTEHSSVWRAIQSPDGKIFYFNSLTGETRWETPMGAPSNPNPAPTRSSPPLPPLPSAVSLPQGDPHATSSSTSPGYTNLQQNDGSWSTTANASTNTNYNSNPGPSSICPQPNSPYNQNPYPTYPQSAGNPYARKEYGQPPSQQFNGVPFQNQSQLSPPPPPEPQLQRSSGAFRSLFATAGKVLNATLSPPPQSIPMVSPYGGGSVYNSQGYSGYMPAPGPGVMSTQPFTGDAGSVGNVIVNGYPLDQAAIGRLQMMGVRIIPGRYWYDTRSGAWGIEGGPCLGVSIPGQFLGGPLRSDASGPSGTGVFINGRQIHAQDALTLQAMGVTPIPGRWWMEADGRYGIEGSWIPLGTLAKMGTGGSGAHSWSGAGSGGDIFGGTDGQGMGYVGGKDSTGRMWSVSYGN